MRTNEMTARHWVLGVVVCAIAIAIPAAGYGWTDDGARGVWTALLWVVVLAIVSLIVLAVADE